MLPGRCPHALSRKTGSGLFRPQTSLVRGALSSSSSERGGVRRDETELEAEGAGIDPGGAAQLIRYRWAW